MRSIISLTQRYFLVWHFVVAVAAAALWGVFLFLTPYGDLVYCYISDGLPALYRASITVAGSLMGFSMTVTVLAKNLWDKDLFVFTGTDQHFERQLWAAMRHSTWSLGALALVSVVCVLVSGNSDMVKLFSVPYTGFVVLATVKLFKTVRLVHKMLAVSVTARGR